MAQSQNTPSSSRSRLTQRISAVTDSHINGWTNDIPVENEGYLYNGMVELYKNDPNRPYVTHRPSLNLNTPDTVGDNKGRGVYWWAANNSYYWMNDDVIYRGSYATPCSVYGGHTAIASGTGKVYFAEWSSANDDYLFILDPENDDVYCIRGGAATTVINIGNVTNGTGAPFHPSDPFDFDDLNAFIADEGLTHGAVSLDTYLFLATEKGKIFNSNVDDWLQWNALNFITCERDPDMLAFIGKQQDHIVAIGGRTIEILYDNSNPTDSPLAFRTDISHRVGTPFSESVWEFGDTLYFIAVDAGGDYTLASLENFQINWHRNPAMQGYLWETRYVSDLTFHAHGFSLAGHVFYILTTLDSGTPLISICYDASTDVWSQWETTVGSHTEYQIIGYTPRSAENDSRPYIMFRNGDLGIVSAAHLPIDVRTGSTSVNYNLIVTTGPFDAGTTETKFMHSINFVGTQAQATLAMTIEWSDDNGYNWNSSTLDLKERTSINRLGKFVSRRFRFTLAGGVYTRFEGIDVSFTQGSY